MRLYNLLFVEQIGRLKELAFKLRISERSVYHCIGFMKTELNAPLLMRFKKRVIIKSVSANLVLNDEKFSVVFE